MPSTIDCELIDDDPEANIGTGQKRCRELLNQGNIQSSYIEPNRMICLSSIVASSIERGRQSQQQTEGLSFVSIKFQWSGASGMMYISNLALHSDKWHPNKEPLVTHLQAWLGPLNEAGPLGSSSTQAPSGPSSALGPSISAMTSTGNGGRPASASRLSLKSDISMPRIKFRFGGRFRRDFRLDWTEYKERHNSPAAMPGQELGRSCIEEEWGVGILTLAQVTAIQLTILGWDTRRCWGEADGLYEEGGKTGDTAIPTLDYDRTFIKSRLYMYCLRVCGGGWLKPSTWESEDVSGVHAGRSHKVFVVA
ncbi:hypothetical protein C8J56DRAFT_907522 [Mycena floridula]|nr:hypothetical protein C8J56DRAFT_907522 [Mycena floridula]